MLQKVFAPEHLVPAILGILGAAGVSSIKFVFDIRDSAKNYQELKSDMETVKRQATDTDRKVERILGYFEGSRSVTVTIPPQSK